MVTLHCQSVYLKGTHTQTSTAHRAGLVANPRGARLPQFMWGWTWDSHGWLRISLRFVASWQTPGFGNCSAGLVLSLVNQILILITHINTYPQRQKIQNDIYSFWNPERKALPANFKWMIQYWHFSVPATR